MINELLVVCVYRGLTWTAELAGTALHNLVHDAGWIFVPAQIFPGGKYLVFNFSRYPGIQIPFVNTIGYIPYVGYIKEPR
jgi:hypothetical protein